MTAFSPALDNGWVGWDDPRQLLDNPYFRGLGLERLRWMFTNAHIGQYVPLAWLTFGLDYCLWGMQPWGYHLTSVALHALTAVLFYGLSRQLLALGLGRPSRAVDYAAAACALFWALHPLRVESVAWISQRRDVLSGLFYVATLWLYAAAPPRGAARRRRLAAAWLAYAAALFSKASVVTLPAALFLLDVFPLRRLAVDVRRWSAPSARKALAEKIPFVILAVAGVWAETWALSSYSRLERPALHDLAPNIPKAVYGLAFYLHKSVWPTPLLPVYEPSQVLSLFSPSVWLSAAGLFLIFAVVWRLRRRLPALIVAAAFYVVTIAPFSGIVRIGAETLAYDRFSYLPSLSLNLIAAAGLLALWRRGWRSSVVLASAVAAVFGWQTWVQTRCWRDSLSLWSCAAAKAPQSAVVCSNLAAALAESGDYAAALRQAQAAAAIKPWSAAALDNEGLALLNLNRTLEARRAFERLVRLDPAYAQGHEHLGLAAEGLGDHAAALASFERAADLRPGRAVLRCRRARALAALGRGRPALEAFKRCLAEDPSLANFRIDYGLRLAASGRHQEAIAQYRQALFGPCDLAAAQANWAQAALALGRFDSARRHAEEAVRLKPGLLEARLTLANALARQGRLRQAAGEYRRILKARPDYEPARRNLGAITPWL